MRRLPRDPVCGMVIDADKVIKRRIGDRTFYFCSEARARSFEQPEQPEQELKAIKRRVFMALAGVVSVAAELSPC